MKKERDWFLDGIGFYLRVSRKEQGLSQKAIAEKAGINRKHLGRIEKGKINITIKTLEKLCEALGVFMHDLIQRACAHKMAMLAGKRGFPYFGYTKLTGKTKKNS